MLYPFEYHSHNAHVCHFETYAIVYVRTSNLVYGWQRKRVLKTWTVSSWYIFSLPISLNMANKEISPHTVLKNHGGAENKDFAQIINKDQDQDEIDIIRCSPYYLPSSLPSELISEDNFFGVLRLNAQSLFAKFDGLIAMLELFGSQRIHFPIICIQETWITDESKFPLVSIEGYNCYYVTPTASSHGGLITYVDNSFEVTVIKKIDFSTVWEGLFLELKHDSLENKFVILEIYISLREITTMLTTFTPLQRKLNQSYRNLAQLIPRF